MRAYLLQLKKRPGERTTKKISYLLRRSVGRQHTVVDPISHCITIDERERMIAFSTRPA